MWPQEVVAMKAQKTIGIRELKEQLSGHIKEVKKGATLVITERGKPVARLLPVSPAETPIEARLHELVDAGVIAWSGRKLSASVPTVPVKGTKTVAEMLIEDRD
jgi:prevent-host-death family protein